MRRIATLTLLLLFAASLSQPGSADELIPWAGNLEQAQQVAAQRNQLVLLHFWAVDCPPCRALESNVFSRPEVAQAVATHYVPVKVNAKEQMQLARKYGVDRWPTDVVITPGGQELHRTVSPQDPVQYAALFTQVAKRAGVSGPMIAQAAYQPGQTAQRTVGYGQGSATNREVGSPQISYGSPAAPTAPRYGAPPAENAAPHGAPAGSAYGQNAYAPQQGAYPANQNFPGNQAAPPSQAYPPSQAGQARPPVNAGAAPSGGSYAGPAAQAGPYGAPPAGSRYGDSRYGDSPYGAPPAANMMGSRYGESAPPPAAGGGRYGEGSASPGQTAFGQAPAGDSPYGRSPGSAPDSRYNSPYGGPASSSAPPAGSRYGEPPVEQRGVVDRQPAAGDRGAEQREQRSDGSVERVAASGSAPSKSPPEPAMAGYCPVTLVDGQKWKKADKKYGAFHRNRLYLFAGAEEQQKFLAKPDYYSPVMEGYDPIKYLDSGKLVDGRRDHGVFFNNRVYLFADEPTLQQFWTNPQHYVGLVEQATRETGKQRR